ncbi:hypothetical protein ACFOWE_32920 [Planomonospora corallina]|uniref:Uncharacterized protein n=1 Tax=Planomonospora corallina TaxID=1806052 RepID=A0ABV8IGI3_9ACTN
MAREGRDGPGQDGLRRHGPGGDGTGRDGPGADGIGHRIEHCAGPGGPGQGSGMEPVEDVPFERRLDDFYSPGVPLDGLRPRAAGTGVPADFLLRVLEPPPVKVRHIPLVDLLRRPYRALGEDG